MNFVLEQLSALDASCHIEIDHFKLVADESGFSPELRAKAKEQIATWAHRQEQIETAMIILEKACCKKD